MNLANRFRALAVPEPAPSGSDDAEAAAQRARLASLETSVRKLLKYGVSYAASEPVLLPVGVPADFIDQTHHLSQEYWDWLREEHHDWWRGQELDLAELMRRDPAPLPECSNREG